MQGCCLATQLGQHAMSRFELDRAGPMLCNECVGASNFKDSNRGLAPICPAIAGIRCVGMVWDMLLHLEAWLAAMCRQWPRPLNGCNAAAHPSLQPWSSQLALLCLSTLMVPCQNALRLGPACSAWPCRLQPRTAVLPLLTSGTLSSVRMTVRMGEMPSTTPAMMTPPPAVLRVMRSPTTKGLVKNCKGLGLRGWGWGWGQLESQSPRVQPQRKSSTTTDTGLTKMALLSASSAGWKMAILLSQHCSQAVLVPS